MKQPEELPIRYITLSENEAFFALLRAGEALPIDVRAERCGACRGTGRSQGRTDPGAHACRECAGYGCAVPDLDERRKSAMVSSDET